MDSSKVRESDDDNLSLMVAGSNGLFINPKVSPATFSQVLHVYSGFPFASICFSKYFLFIFLSFPFFHFLSFAFSPSFPLPISLPSFPPPPLFGTITKGRSAVHWDDQKYQRLTRPPQLILLTRIGNIYVVP